MFRLKIKRSLTCNACKHTYNGEEIKDVILNEAITADSIESLLGISRTSTVMKKCDNCSRTIDVPHKVENYKISK